MGDSGARAEDEKGECIMGLDMGIRLKKRYDLLPWWFKKVVVFLTNGKQKSITIKRKMSVMALISATGATSGSCCGRFVKLWVRRTTLILKQK